MFKEFRDFAMRGSVVDLAVGVIIGAAFAALVNSLVNDVIMPPVGYVLGGVDFRDFFISLSGGDYPSLAAAKAAGAATLNYGLFLNAVINFLIVAIALFLIVRCVNRCWRQQEAPPAPPSRSEALLAEIRDLLLARR